jgi:hypothetical protein
MSYFKLIDRFIICFRMSKAVLKLYIQEKEVLTIFEEADREKNISMLTILRQKMIKRIKMVK